MSINDAELDRMTARECFEYLSRSLEGGEVAILKAIAMTRAHERRKWAPDDELRSDLRSALLPAPPLDAERRAK